MTQILWGFLNQAQWLKLYLEIFCAASGEVSRAEVCNEHYWNGLSSRGGGSFLQGAQLEQKCCANNVPKCVLFSDV